MGLGALSFAEPPDVKKWFSSYVYESPALGSDKAFLASSLEGGKCQNYSFCSEARRREEDESPLDFGNVTKIDRAVSSKKTDSNLSTEAEINEVPYLKHVFVAVSLVSSQYSRNI